ncbi:hypothetical protein AgCh_022917 [Apium graveolens]
MIGAIVYVKYLKAHLEFFCAQEVANFTSFSSGIPTENTNSFSLKEVAWNDSPPWREDDKDGHYVFAVGDNLTFRCKIYSKMGEGTFGQVLKCWDKEGEEMVATKVVRGVEKYREAAMIEVDVLQQLGKNEKGRNCAFERYATRRYASGNYLYIAYFGAL